MPKRPQKSVPKPPADEPAAAPAVAVRPQRWAWVALVLVLLANGYVRYRFLDVPLERDEGEFVYMAERLLEGEPPYKSGHAMKMPGIYVAYALAISCFGHTTQGIHLGLAVANSVAIVLVFLITRRWYCPSVAVVAAGLYALLALDPEVNGAAAQAEHFVMVPVLQGLWLLQIIYARATLQDPAAPRPSLLGLAAAGFCFGTGAITKQHGAALCLLAAWIVIWQWWNAARGVKTQPRSATTQPRSVKTLAIRLSALAAGGVLPLLIACALLAMAGAFSDFWFWTITYSRTYATGTPWSEGLHNFLERIAKLWRSSPVIWSLTLLGLTALVWDREARKQRATMLAFVGFSLLAMVPGLYFRGHYFVLVLPAVAILAALGCQALVNLVFSLARISLPRGRGVAVLAMGLVALVATAVWQRQYLLLASPQQVSRMIYMVEPFTETIEIADYIKEHSRETGPIMVLGSEPQIYFYTGRRAASPHIYMYPLMEIQPYALQMQQDMAREIAEAQPEWIILEAYSSGWVRRPESEIWILDWMTKVLDKYYDRVGIVDFSEETTRYVWNKEMAQISPTQPFWFGIYRRKDAPPTSEPATTEGPASATDQQATGGAAKDSGS